MFKVDNTGNETVLYSFTGGTDGAFPYAGLVRDSKGNLYGATDFGGSHVNSGAVFAPIRNLRSSIGKIKENRREHSRS